MLHFIRANYKSQKTMQPKKLEQYKYFGIIAWVVFIAFALFLLSLVLKLQTAIQNMQTLPTVEEIDINDTH